MGRWILLLPLSLFVRGNSPLPPAVEVALGDGMAYADSRDADARRAKLAVYIAAVVGWQEDPLARLLTAPYIKNVPSATLFATLTAVGDNPLLTASLAPSAEELVNDFYEDLRRKDPLAFFEMAIERYEREVRGYTAISRKKEKVAGKYNDPEEIEVAVREKPFSVYMNWLQGARLTAAQKVIYVEGENNNKLLALPKLSFLGIQTRDVDGADAKAGSRYTIDHFGIHKGTQRTVASMKAARDRKQLHLKYLGEGKEPRLGDRPMYVFRRTPYEPLEEEGLNDLTLYFDKETWLQVGSILKDKNGELIAEYFFRDIVLNPEFPEWQFTRQALEKK
jgi:hypothetical protein